MVAAGEVKVRPLKCRTFFRAALRYSHGKGSTFQVGQTATVIEQFAWRWQSSNATFACQ